MTSLTASEARASLYRLVDEATLNHQPALITGKRHDAVLGSADNWGINSGNDVPAVGSGYARVDS